MRIASADSGSESASIRVRRPHNSVMRWLADLILSQSLGDLQHRAGTEGRIEFWVGELLWTGHPSSTL